MTAMRIADRYPSFLFVKKRFSISAVDVSVPRLRRSLNPNRK